MDCKDDRHEWEKLPEDILDAKCTDLSLSKIAEKIIVWEHFVPRLGLTEAEKVEIQRNNMNNYFEQKYQFLIKWKEKYGSKATYRVLLTCFDECEKGELVEELIAIIKKGLIIYKV